MPGATEPLKPWKRSDSLTAAHLNEAWDRLLKMGSIDGASQVGNGSVVYPGVRHAVIGTFDAKVIPWVDNDPDDSGDPCKYGLDFDDARYYVQPVFNRADATSNKFWAKIVPIAYTPDTSGYVPDKPVIAYNLWEHVWQSHFIDMNDYVCCHVIKTYYRGTDKYFTWYVFNVAPKPVRQAIVKTTPANCDVTVDAWDQVQMGMVEGCRVTSTLVLSTKALAGAFDLKATNSVYYCPTGKITGVVIGWYPQMHIGLFCDTADPVYSGMVYPTNVLAFAVNDFTIAEGTYGGCFSASHITWRGFDVTGGYDSANICFVKELKFQADQGLIVAGLYTEYIVRIETTSDTDTRVCGECTETVTQAIITAKVVLPTGMTVTEYEWGEVFVSGGYLKQKRRTIVHTLGWLISEGDWEDVNIIQLGDCDE